MLARAAYAGGVSHASRATTDETPTRWPPRPDWPALATPAADGAFPFLLVVLCLAVLLSIPRQDSRQEATAHFPLQFLWPRTMTRRLASSAEVSLCSTDWQAGQARRDRQRSLIFYLAVDLVPAAGNASPSRLRLRSRFAFRNSIHISSHTHTHPAAGRRETGDGRPQLSDARGSKQL